MRDLLYVYRSMACSRGILKFVFRLEISCVSISQAKHTIFPLFFFDFAEFSGLLYFSHLLIMWCVECVHTHMRICPGFRPQQPSNRKLTRGKNYAMGK